MLAIVQGIGLLIVAISMLGLVNAVTMDIIERTREIGVLRCLRPARDLRRIFAPRLFVSPSEASPKSSLYAELFLSAGHVLSAMIGEAPT